VEADCIDYLKVRLEEAVVAAAGFKKVDA